MLNWIIKRIFNDKNVGYIVEKAKPKIQIVLDEYLKESIINLLSDEQVAGMVTQYGDALFNRYKQKAFGTIGGLQKGVNYAIEKQTPEFDIFDEDGRISVRKILPQLLRGGIGGILGGNQAQTNPRSGKGSQNAPNM